MTGNKLKDLESKPMEDQSDITDGPVGTLLL